MKDLQWTVSSGQLIVSNYPLRTINYQLDRSVPRMRVALDSEDVLFKYTEVKNVPDR
jgi:hypothetical protein